MSIKKEANGTYTVFYTIKDLLDIDKKPKRTKKRGFKTYKEANIFEKSITIKKTSDITFGDLFIQSQNYKEVSSSTSEKRTLQYEKYLKELHSVKYMDITKPILIELRNKIGKFDISNRTKNDILALIKNTCKYANDIYDLPNNSKVIKNFKVKKIEFEIWSPEQYRRFEESLIGLYDSENFIPFFHTLFWCGLRKGEARALTIDDLDVENKTLTIKQSMSKYRKSLKDPKTFTSARTIKIDKLTFDMLKPLKENHEKWLFGDYKALNLNTIDKTLKKAIDKANKDENGNDLPKEKQIPKIRIHDFRHSHATFLICNGANIVAVSKRLGHKSINITLETYAHLLKDTENALISLIENNNM